jgi:ATP-dependent Zn protease
MPRGQALGITFQLPEADKDSYSRKELKASIDVALGGRAAEEMIYGIEDTTTGCSSDLERATRVAGNMVRVGDGELCLSSLGRVSDDDHSRTTASPTRSVWLHTLMMISHI